MPLSLDQYADFLDTRDLAWPMCPPVDGPKVKPSLTRMPKVRAVLWTVYGTLLAIPPGGDLLFEHPTEFVMSTALEKTIAEFKMWGSMSRKPGQPSEYMGKIYRDLLTDQRMAAGGVEKHPEILAEKIWEAVLKRLLQKDYKFDAGFFGAINEYSRKIAYFFHASLQATACYPTADRALAHVAGAGLVQGLLADGQCFTAVQLRRGLDRLEGGVRIDDVLPATCRFLSCDLKGRKPSERLFGHAIESLAARGIAPEEILHVGSRMQQDLIPARRLGMKTALFAGDKTSLQATTEQLKEPGSRPDLLLSEPGQIAEVVG